MRIFAFVMVIVILVCAAYLGYHTVDRMVNDGLTLGEAASISWDDFIHLRVSKNEDPNFIGFDVSNQIQYRGLTSW